MFKNLTHLEKAMCDILKTINEGLYPDVESDSDMSFAMNQCVEDGYIANLVSHHTLGGTYLFESIGACRISEKGYAFLKSKSFLERLKAAIFDVLKGTLGYILGILSTVSVEILMYALTGSGMIERLARQIQRFLP